MFKWTFLERESIVESRTGLHLSLRGLDVQIMAIKDWWNTYNSSDSTTYGWHGNFWIHVAQKSAVKKVRYWREWVYMSIRFKLFWKWNNSDSDFGIHVSKTNGQNNTFSRKLDLRHNSSRYYNDIYVIRKLLKRPFFWY